MGKIINEMIIRILLPGILKKLGGRATASQVIRYLKSTTNILTPEDRVKQPSRNGEEKWEQKIRNLVSHCKCYKQGLDREEFPEGFAIVADRSGIKPRYYFELIDECDVLVISPEARKAIKESDQRTREYLRKRDTHDRSLAGEQAYTLGEAAERYVYQKELEYVQEHFPTYLSEVEWTSHERGDGAGYDIKSVNHSNPDLPLLIEVKASTTKMSRVHFRMTKNEYEFLVKHKNTNNLLVYWCDNPNSDWQEFCMQTFTPEEILDKGSCVPTTYEVYL